MLEKIEYPCECIRGTPLPCRKKKMSSELVFKTTSDLEAQKQQLLSQLTSVKMELSKRSKLAEAVKRLAIANSDITQGKEQLREIYEMHETAMAEHERATRHLSWCAEELDLARANVRSSIRRKRRANKSLKRLRNSYPPLPSSPPPEAIWSPKDDELAYNPSLKQYHAKNDCYSPVSQCDTFLDAGVEIQQPVEKTNDKSEMAKKIEEIRGLWRNHTWGVNINGFSTCMCEDCYEEKDSNYWFEEWECGMRSPDEEEPPKTEKEVDEEEEMRAIWEDRRRDR